MSCDKKYCCGMRELAYVADNNDTTVMRPNISVSGTQCLIATPIFAEMIQKVIDVFCFAHYICR